MLIPYIERMLDNTTMDCASIATTLDCPVDYVNYVVEERWNKIIQQHTYADESADADAIHYGESL